MLTCDQCTHSVSDTESGAEPWIATNPADPLHLVAIAQGRQFANGNFPLVAASRDGGETWALAQLPGGPPETATYNFAADVMVAFSHGKVVVAALAARAQATPGVGQAGAGVSLLDLAVWSSADGGDSFAAPVVVQRVEGPFVYAFTPQGYTVRGLGAVDKDFLVADAATGELHLFWSRLSTQGIGEESTILRSASRDDGVTWTTPVVVGPGYSPNVAALNGTLVMTYSGFDYMRRVSHDGGATWNDAVTMGKRTGTIQNAPVALWMRNGTLHAAVVWVEGDNHERVMLAQSRDGATTWSTPQAVLPETATARRNPATAVDAAGRGILAAYVPTSGGNVQVAVLALADGDVFGVPVLVGPDDTPGAGVYEYFGAAAGPLPAVVFQDKDYHIFVGTLTWQ